MKFISHRGNLFSSDLDTENKPAQIEKVIDFGYDCEIDLWISGAELFLGHDGPHYLIQEDFIHKYFCKLWIHCKNIDAILWSKDSGIKGLNYFWHQNDLVTMTSLGHLWAYPGNQPIKGSVAVLPEINDERDLSDCFGICTDQLIRYKDLYGEI